MDYSNRIIGLYRICSPDCNGILFIRFPIVEIAAALSRSLQTCKRSLNELEQAGMIMRVRQGIGEVSHIYILRPKEDANSPCSHCKIAIMKRSENEKEKNVYSWRLIRMTQCQRQEAGTFVERERKADLFDLLKKPVGKAAYFTNVFTNFAGTNMRKYETI